MYMKKRNLVELKKALRSLTRGDDEKIEAFAYRFKDIVSNSDVAIDSEEVKNIWLSKFESAKSILKMMGNTEGIKGEVKFDRMVMATTIVMQARDEAEGVGEERSRREKKKSKKSKATTDEIDEVLKKFLKEQVKQDTNNSKQQQLPAPSTTKGADGSTESTNKASTTPVPPIPMAPMLPPNAIPFPFPMMYPPLPGMIQPGYPTYTNTQQQDGRRDQGRNDGYRNDGYRSDGYCGDFRGGYRGRGDRERGRGSWRGRGRGRGDRQCFNCGGYGHISAECRKNRNNSSNGQATTNPPPLLQGQGANQN